MDAYNERSHLIKKLQTVREETIESSASSNSSNEAQILFDETKLYKDRWSVIPSLWCGAFLSALDSTIIASTYAVMGSELGDSSRATWIATSYMLSSSALQPLYGGFSDIFGRKTALLWANGLFFFGSLGCAFAPSMKHLIIARIIAGMGSAGLSTLSSIVVSDLVPLSERSTYNGFANLVYGCGQVIGAPVGGALADSIGWRFAFLIQCPITFISYWIIWYKVNIPISTKLLGKNPSLKDIDLLGSFFLIVAIVSILFVLQFTGSNNSWNSLVTLSTLSITIVSFISFYYVESRVENPIVLLKVLLSRNPLCSGFTNFFGYMGAFSIMFNVPLFLQVVVGESAALSGSRLITNIIGMCAGSLSAGVVIRYTQKYYHTIVFGVLTEIFGSILVSTLTVDSYTWHYELYLFPCGFGHGVILSATLMAVISSVEREEQAKATSISYLFRVLGGAFGITFTSSINNYFVRLGLNKAFKELSNKEELIESIITSTITTIKHLPPVLAELTRETFDMAIHMTFYATIGIYLISFCFAIYIREYPLNK